MKHTLHALPVLLAASVLAQTAPAPAPAKSDWTQTHNLALATDYVFRGVSQIGSRNALALSGGTDVAHASGFSLGVWASNQNINEEGNDSLEVDTYAGYATSLGKAELALGIIAYNYPGASVYNTIEASASVSFAGLKAKYSHALTEYFGFVDSDGTGYAEVSYSLQVAKDLSFGLGYGWTLGRGDQIDYEDYKVSLSYPVGGYTLGVAFTDSDAGGVSYSNKVLDEGTVVVSLSRTF